MNALPRIRASSRQENEKSNSELVAQASAYRLSFLTYGIGLTLLGAAYATASLRRR